VLRDFDLLLPSAWFRATARQQRTVGNRPTQKLANAQSRAKADLRWKLANAQSRAKADLRWKFDCG
jgi:hypothetical protein